MKLNSELLVVKNKIDFFNQKHYSISYRIMNKMNNTSMSWGVNNNKNSKISLSDIMKQEKIKKNKKVATPKPKHTWKTQKTKSKKTFSEIVAEERKHKLDEERKKKLDEERKKKLDEERKHKLDEERKKKLEEERKKKLEEERKKKLEELDNFFHVNIPSHIEFELFYQTILNIIVCRYSSLDLRDEEKLKELPTVFYRLLWNFLVCPRFAVSIDEDELSDMIMKYIINGTHPIRRNKAINLILFQTSLTYRLDISQEIHKYVLDNGFELQIPPLLMMSTSNKIINDFKCNFIKYIKELWGMLTTEVYPKLNK